MGLCDAVLIKDNHLALAADQGITAADAVRRARDSVRHAVPGYDPVRFIIEIEIDALDQLDGVLSAGPDIVLLDNMTPAQLRSAVARRDAVAPQVELEASGDVTLQNVYETALTGVNRISVGALTHSAKSLGIGLDWLDSSDR
jgi:nicotinate-nucleotide pyrophosphorylase (carboxylating)